jgi:hypothetical protein
MNRQAPGKACGGAGPALETALCSVWLKDCVKGAKKVASDGSPGYYTGEKLNQNRPGSLMPGG